MAKEQMMDKVIRKFGFENELTILFCELAEILPEEQLIDAFIALKCYSA